MKTQFLKTIFYLFTMFTIISCTTDDSNNNNNNNTNNSINQITNIAENGTWKITYFYDKDHEETNNFNGYIFTFNTDGSLIAEKGNNTVTGTWSVTNSNSNDDSSDDKDFNIFFAVPDSSNFEDLNDDWEIIATNDNKIELIDISGGNGGTDYLTFEKN